MKRRIRIFLQWMKSGLHIGDDWDKYIDDYYEENPR